MRISFVFYCLLFLITSNAYAFKFSPMSTSISFDDKKNSVLFYLENDSSSPIAVVTKVMAREMDESGVENNQDIKGEVTVYPTQLIIPANEKRSVKVSWEGKTKPTQELAYRLIAEQLPIELGSNKKDKANIKVLLRYVAALYVGNDNFASDVKLKNILIEDKNVVLVVENSGNKHQVLMDLKLQLKEGSKETLFTSNELKGMAGENILPGKTRRFTFSRLGKFKDIKSDSKVTLNFEKE